MNQQIYRIIRAYLDIESAAIVPDKKLINSIVDVYAKSLDALADVPFKSDFPGDFYDLINESLKDTKKFDNNMKVLIPIIQKNLLPENGGNSKELKEKGIEKLNIQYETNGRSGAQYHQSTGITIKLNLKTCKTVFEEWYAKKDKNKIIKVFYGLIGHELIHNEQARLTNTAMDKKYRSLSYKEKLDKNEKIEEEKKDFENYKKWLSDKIKELHILENVSNYLNEKGKIVTLRDFKRYYSKIQANDPSWVKNVPPYLKPIYNAIKDYFNENYTYIPMLKVTDKIYREFFEIYERHTDDTDIHTYLSEPAEIMAYAYSTVEKALRKGRTKEELLEMLSNPEKHAEESYALDSYKFYKDLKGDKNISDKEKKDTWHKYLKYVAEYIDKIYKKEPR